MFGIGGEWWILYFLVFIAAGLVNNSVKQLGLQLTPASKEENGDDNSAERSTFQLRRELFYETTQEQLGSIYQAVQQAAPDISILELDIKEIVDRLDRIEKALAAKVGEAGRA